MQRLRDGNATYHEFRQRVRRFRRDELLRAVAVENARMEREKQRQPDPPLERPNYVQPFALAGIARTGLIAANNHRPGGPSRDDLWELCWWYCNIYEPAFEEDDPGRVIRALWNRIGYEQYAHQYSTMENLSRTALLLDKYLPRITGCPSSTDWEGFLGAPITDYMRVAFSMYTAAVNNDGTINREVLRMDHVLPIFARTGVETALQIVDNHFASTINELKTVGRSFETAGLEKWSLNPLAARPIISWPNGDFTMPWPWLVIDKVTPNGLYYVGLEGFGTSFTDGLGKAFELYVGDQLDLLTGATVCLEIAYGRSGELTVDFFVITTEIVVLIEVKSSRPVMASRLGLLEGDGDTQKKLGKAIEQVNSTAKLIREKHPMLACIPSNIPLAAMVVTLEPYHSLREIGYDDFLPEASIPTVFISSHELEGTVAMLQSDRDIGTRLMSAFYPTDERKPSLSIARQDLPKARNPIVETGWRMFADDRG